METPSTNACGYGPLDSQPSLFSWEAVLICKLLPPEGLREVENDRVTGLAPEPVVSLLRVEIR